MANANAGTGVVDKQTVLDFIDQHWEEAQRLIGQNHTLCLSIPSGGTTRAMRFLGPEQVAQYATGGGPRSGTPYST